MARSPIALKAYKIPANMALPTSTPTGAARLHSDRITDISGAFIGTIHAVGDPETRTPDHYRASDARGAPLGTFETWKHANDVVEGAALVRQRTA